MQNATATTPAGTAVLVNSTTGKRPGVFVRLNDDGTATVKANGRARKVKAFNVYLPDATDAPKPAPTERDVTTVKAELVRPGHVLVNKDGRRFRVTSVSTRVDPRTLRLDPTRRTAFTRDSDGVTQVFTLNVGRNIRVAK